MKKVLVFGASNAHASINVQLARHASTLLSDVEVIHIDLNDFEMPIFSVDRESASGIPEAAQRFKQHIRECDGVLISFAEHNGSYSVAFKNVMDWTSRMKSSLWLDKPLCFLATSPGARGGQSVLETALTRAPRMGGRVISSFSLPSFEQNFSAESGVTDPELARKLQEAIDAFQSALT